MLLPPRYLQYCSRICKPKNTNKICQRLHAIVNKKIYQHKKIAHACINLICLPIKKHVLQQLGNLLKINFFLGYHNSVESAKAPVYNQLSHSECKPTCKCLLHSFYHQWTCCSQKLVYSSGHLYKTNKFYLLILMVLCVWLPVTYD